MKLLVTGGCGFIGSNFIRHALRSHADWSIVNLDKLTYAGNLENLRDVEDDARYSFICGDICDRPTVDDTLALGVDAIVNFAAETHVDRSIRDPAAFLRTDVLGTHVLLEAVRTRGISRYLQVSTDEVYGHVAEGSCREDRPLAPRSPYSASKAAADLQVIAYHVTYRLPVVITRASNTYGPYQYPEKLIPLFIINLINDRQVPIYGDGLQVRDWLHVDDHCRAIEHVLMNGAVGEIYNVGSGNTRTNMQVALDLLSLLRRDPDKYLQHVPDRPGHDRRYSLDSAKANELGWRPSVAFEEGIRKTVLWYQSNEKWWRPILAGQFDTYYRTQYASLGQR